MTQLVAVKQASVSVIEDEIVIWTRIGHDAARLNMAEALLVAAGLIRAIMEVSENAA